jgi:hypothetical protein
MILKNYIYNFYTKDLGIDINLSKTKKVTDTNLVAEYVSRNLNYDVDVSRISANICRAVEKNLLDLPELARHLEERDVHSLPVKKIITEKSKDFTLFVRTFYLLANMYPARPGMKLLLNEIKSQFSDFVYSDNIIGLLTKEQIIYLKYSFLIVSIQELLPDIQERMSHIFKTALPGYECSLDMIADNTRENSFKYSSDDELSLELKTTIKILSKCYELINSLSRVNAKPDPPQPRNMMVVSSKDIKTPEVSFNDLERIFTELNRILQGLTFKELGVIDSTKEPYRPSTTKLYNFVSKLRSYSDIRYYDTVISECPDNHTWNIFLEERSKKDNKIFISHLEESFLPKKSTSKTIHTIPKGIV